MAKRFLGEPLRVASRLGSLSSTVPVTVQADALNSPQLGSGAGINGWLLFSSSSSRKGRRWRANVERDLLGASGWRGYIMLPPRR